jgi:hypothetical protein
LPAPGFGVPSEPFNSFVWQRSLAAVVDGEVVAGGLVVVAGARVVVVLAAVVVVVAAAVVAVVGVAAVVVVVAAAVVATVGALLSEPQAARTITAVASHASRTAVV